MSKIHSPSQTSWYYLAIGVGAVTAIVSLGLMINAYLLVYRQKVEPDPGGTTPQELMLLKVLDIIQNKVVSYPDLTTASNSATVIDKLPQE
jgi:hypothetical protein